MLKTQTKKKGGVSPTDYPFMLTDGAATTASTATAKASTPGLTGGTRARKANGGCGCASGSMRKGGNITMPAGVELTPFISALALLGARMLADKNPSLNMSNLFGTNKPKSSARSSVRSSTRSSAPKTRSKY